VLAARDIALVQETVTELAIQGQAERARAVEAVLAVALSAESGRRPDQPREYMTTGQAANLLGVRLETIRNWVATGRLDGLRVGGRVLVHRDAVRAKLESLPTTRPEPRESTPESIQAALDWQEFLLSGLPAEQVARQEALIDKMEDGQPLSRAERSELAALEREIATAAAEHLKGWLRRTSASAP
jgi:excisionase family DNA binding protein